MGSEDKRRRYYVFCDTPRSLQNMLDSLSYYDIKEAFVLPGTELMVCVIMEDPNEAAREKLERIRAKTGEAASRLLNVTANLLENMSKKFRVNR